MRKLAEAYHWTPRQVAEITLPQWAALWLDAPVKQQGAQRHGRERALELLNIRRAKAGLPPKTWEECWPDVPRPKTTL